MFNKRYEVLSPDISVPNRLKQLQAWDADYREQEHRARERMRALLAEAKAETSKVKRIRIEQKINNYQIMTDRLSFLRVQVPYTLDKVAANNLETIFASLAPQYAKIEKPEKSLWLNNVLFVVTPDVRNLAAILDDMQVAASNHMAYHKLITAPARNGKTWALNWYAFCHWPQILETYTFHPVIMVEPLHDDRTRKSLLQQIVIASGDNYADETYPQLVSKVNSIFSGCNLHTLMIDEIMHLNTYHQRRSVITLANQGGVGGRVAIVGASVNAHQFWANDEEIEGRFPNPYELALYKGERLQGLLAFLEPLLPFSQASHLSLASIEVKQGKKKISVEGPVNFIEEATGGRLGYIMHLLRRAASVAIENEHPSITVDLLRTVWGTIPKDPS